MNHLPAWISLIFILTQTGAGRAGDVRHVISHDRVLVQTDPSRGFNPYPGWVMFPPDTELSRRIVLLVTYQRPESLHCGEWDYIDNIYLRRTGGQNGPAHKIELGRMISPYGWRFPEGWKFTWRIDVTDFAFLLRDSVEIEFNHTGYETKDDRGWLITLDFELTEGRPAMECLGMDSLWCGSFPYGDTTQPIADRLRPFPFTVRPGAGIARLRITQTGHGMDDLEDCAEFCRKYRQVFFDDSLVGQRDIWRECGDNPLYPQAGTWIFDRANWCPGSAVAPDQYDYPVRPNSAHVVKIMMQPYANSGHPTANYYIYSYLFHYRSAWAGNDAALDEIIAPSPDDEYSRINPIIANPMIRVRNPGRNPLASLVIRYGYRGDQEKIFRWRGRIPSQGSAELTLPGILEYRPDTFRVRLEAPNGRKDEYPSDNTGTSTALSPPVFPPRFVLALRTNREPGHNAYLLSDAAGKVIRKRMLGTLQPEFLYLDTFDLKPGAYLLNVTDTAGDGLDFWFNQEGGYGYVRLLDRNGRLVRNFISDFGSGIRQPFVVRSGATAPAGDSGLPIVNLFPALNAGMFSLDIFFNEPHDLRIKIQNEDSSRTVFDQVYPGTKDAILPIDISMEPDGVYVVQAFAEDTVITRKMKISRKE